MQLQENIKQYSLEKHNKENYIIDKIGCYNFCPTGTCTEAKEVKTETAKDGTITVVNPNGRYETEYEFVKKVTSEDWKLGDWTTEKLEENENRKLVDTKTQYTGQKKVTSGTKLYEEIKYGYKKIKNRIRKRKRKFNKINIKYAIFV